MSVIEEQFIEQEMTMLAQHMNACSDRKGKKRLQRALAAIVALKRCGYLPKGVA